MRTYRTKQNRDESCPSSPPNNSQNEITKPVTKIRENICGNANGNKKSPSFLKGFCGLIPKTLKF